MSFTEVVQSSTSKISFIQKHGLFYDLNEKKKKEFGLINVNVSQIII